MGRKNGRGSREAGRQWRVRLSLPDKMEEGRLQTEKRVERARAREWERECIRARMMRREAGWVQRQDARWRLVLDKMKKTM